MDAKARYSAGVTTRKIAALHDAELNESIAAGIYRAMQYKDQWQAVDINDVVEKFAPGSDPVYKGGKLLFNSDDGRYSVITDVGGGYLRIQDLSVKTKKPLYLNLDGSNGHNEVGSDGKIHGKSKQEYQKTTHFRIKKREEM